MSVLIKGMEIPKNCIDCPCYYPEYYECNIVHNCNPISLDDPIPQYCPLIEVPPHGRLIDADKIPDRFIEVRDLAPTIIQAEGG